MKEDSKVLIKNLTNHSVGFKCVNKPNHFNFNVGQTLPIKWEYVEDVGYDKGFRFLIEESYLKILPESENYADVMDSLQFSHLAEKIEKSLDYNEAKRLLSVVPLSTQYAKIKEYMKEGTETTKKNIANAAIDLGIKDYVVNTAVKNATNIDILKTLELKTAEKEKE